MTAAPSTDRETDDAILARMLGDAEALCLSQDPLLAGQYRHLIERIRAVIEIRACFQPDDLPA